MDLKKVIAGLTAVAVVASAFLLGVGPAVGQSASTLNDPEFDNALSWAYENEMTRYDTVEDFRPFDNLTREQSAKFVDVFAMTNLCLVPDTDMACDFSDIPADPTLDEYVKLSCQLGVFQGSQGMFYPTANLTKAQLIAVLVRAIRSADGLEPVMDETGDPRWNEYFLEARSMNLTNETDVFALDRPVTRYEALLLIYRSASAIDLECDATSQDILDILDDIFGDDTDADDDDMDEDDDDEPAQTESDGTLEVSLSPTTPAGDKVPGLSNVPVAEFELSSTGEPVRLNSLILHRYGIGNDDAVDRVSLFLNDGDKLVRLSNDKSFNSDDEAILTLNPKLEVPTNDSLFVTVVAQIGDSNSASNQEFQIGVRDQEDVLTNGSVDGDFPIKANEFEVAGVDAPEVVITPDGSVSDVELGAQKAEIAKFEMESEDDDIEITNVTLTDGENTIDDAAENFILECNGDEVATQNESNDEYLTFDFDDPFAINEGQTADCRVFADIIAEAGEAIDLYIDEPLDVWGQSDFGFGIAVDVSGYPEGSQVVDILAGELTLVEEDLPRDELKDNTDDAVLGQFRVIVNNGQDLFVEDVDFNFETNVNDASAEIGDLFEDFEIYDATNNTRYDLEDNCETATSNCRLSEDGIDLFLPDGGEVLLQVRADTVNDFSNASPAFDPATDTFTVHLELDTAPGANEFVVKEADDDEQVMDIVPSFLSFNQIDLVESSVDVTELPMSDIDVVRGSTDVVALRFQIETDEVSPALLQDITFDATDDFDQDHVSAVRLYRGVPNGTNSLVESQGGFDIDGGSITFDDFDEIEIPMNSTQPFFVTIDIVDNPTITGDTVTMRIDPSNDPELEDEDNDDMEVNVSSNGTRTITIADLGTLACEFDDSDGQTDRPSIVVGGTTSDLLASYELTADNEPIRVRDIQLTAQAASGGVTGDFQDSFEEVTLLAEDGVTELYNEFITSNVMYLNEVDGPGGGDFIIDEGTENVYVQLTASLIGDNEDGKESGPFVLAMSIPEAEGEASNQDLGNTACNGTSEEFLVRAVRVSNVEFLGINEGENGYSYDSLTNGNGKNIGLFRVTADDWDNEDTDGSDLNLLLDTFTVTISDGANVVSGDVTLRRIDTGPKNPITLTGNTGGGDYVFDLSGAQANGDITASEQEMEAGEVATFLVEADIKGLGGDENASISVEFNNLDSGNFTYTHDGSGAILTDALYLESTTEEGPDVTTP